jgi:hypothetical protein
MPELNDLMKLNFRIGFSKKEILALLTHNNHVVISIGTWNRLCRRLFPERESGCIQVETGWLGVCVKSRGQTNINPMM